MANGEWLMANGRSECLQRVLCSLATLVILGGLLAGCRVKQDDTWAYSSGRHKPSYIQGPTLRPLVRDMDFVGNGKASILMSTYASAGASFKKVGDGLGKAGEFDIEASNQKVGHLSVDGDQIQSFSFDGHWYASANGIEADNLFDGLLWPLWLDWNENPAVIPIAKQGEVTTYSRKFERRIPPLKAELEVNRSTGDWTYVISREP